MDNIDTHDPLTTGAKGLVFLGEKIVVSRRDDKSNLFPLQLDLPGGGCEGQETPFETFQREVKEECNLTLSRDQIVYARRYPSSVTLGKFGFFLAVKLPLVQAQNMRLGNEGLELILMTPTEYLARTDAWPIFQDRTRDYLDWLTETSQN